MIPLGRRHLQRLVTEFKFNSFENVSGPVDRFQLLWIRRSSDNSSKGNFLTKFWKNLGGGNKAKNASNGSGKSTPWDKNHPKEESVVVVKPEDKFRSVLVIELNRRPLMPGTALPVLVSNPKLIKELTDLQRAGGALYVGAFLRRMGSESSSETEDTKHSDPAGHLYEIGTFAQVSAIIPNELSDTTHLMLLGHKRIRRLTIVTVDPLRVTNQTLRDKHDKATDHVKALSMEIISTMRELFKLHPLYGEQLKSLQTYVVGSNMSNVSRLADVGAGISSAEDVVLQEGVLEELHVPSRAQKVLELLKKEIDLVRLQQQIGKRVEEKISKDQRRYFLMEQLKSIKKELGIEKDDKSTLTQKFKDRFAKFEAKAPQEAKVVIEEELDKLNALEPASSEFNVTRNYLEWLTSIPWGTYSDEKLNVQQAKEILDQDHYGLKDVKERILEFIAVGILKGSTQGKILCLVGPPGVGKTSIGSSFAKALNRSYYRFSVGGLSDVAEIKGHRRTYIGAMPGKMVQCLKSTKTSNPFVCIDEIDKLGRGYQGDPASALLELLDPEQNTKFMDHYLDVPVDVSKVLFMCTANVLDTIPTPLLDRMEVIRLSGYLANEKTAIARRYLEPQIREASGIPEGSITLDDAAMELLIKDYCREAGVRNLKKHIEKIYRKCALKLVNAGAKGPKQILEEQPKPESTTDASSKASTSFNGATEDRSGEKQKEEKENGTVDEMPKAIYEGEPIVVTPSSLHDLVGTAPFRSERIFERTPPGVVVGLAWTSMGGSTLYAEAAVAERQKDKGGLVTTGQLGDVMKESSTIAHTVAKSFLLTKYQNVDLRFVDSYPFSGRLLFEQDGPSAGVTLVTALLSLALDQSVKDNLAMTGEVTLKGKVLPVGGIKEKTIAARRADIRHIIFPEGNKKDYEELDEDTKGDLNVYFVSTYEEVFEIAFEKTTATTTSSM